MIACECSGRVREAFRKLGHDAYSCGLLPADDGSPFHLLGDCRRYLTPEWDMLLAFPPCTHLAISGERWFRGKEQVQAEALQLVKTLLDAPIERICLENPISIISTRIRKPDQIIHPWQFGHGEKKATCLWLKGLPLLMPTKIVSGRSKRLTNFPECKRRAKMRSLTYQGIADAMAQQWGKEL